MIDAEYIIGKLGLEMHVFEGGYFKESYRSLDMISNNGFHKKKYEHDVKKMRSDQHSLDDNHKIPLVMIHLIDRRSNKITERIQCIYKFKTQSIVSNSKS